MVSNALGEAEKKSRDWAKFVRLHNKPLSPFERLKASQDVSEAMKERMMKEKGALNPFE